MSKVELKKQKKEELRKHILTAAQNIASDNGWQNVTIRKICDEIGYTAPIVYHYFDIILKCLNYLPLHYGALFCLFSVKC